MTEHITDPDHPPGFRLIPFQIWLADLIRNADHPDIAGVQTFAEAGLTDKPVGLKLALTSGAGVYIQFVRTSAPGGDPDHPDFQIPPGRL